MWSRSLVIKTLTLMLLGITAIVALPTEKIRAQQISDSSPTENTAVKTCVLVYGAVRSPLRIDTQNIRLKEAIEMAGGIAERANGVIQVIHSSSVLTCDTSQSQTTASAGRDARADKQPPPSMDFYTLTDLGSDNPARNPFLQSGDVIVVVEAQPVYVVGKVLTPSSVFLRNQMTLSQAIAMVGGVLPEGNPKKVLLHRMNPATSEKTIIFVDLNAISKHRKADLPLQPYDVIEVPDRNPGHHRFLSNNQLSMRESMYE